MISMFYAKLSLWMAAVSGVIATYMPLARRQKRGSASGEAREPGPQRVLFLYRELPFHGGIPRCLLYLARSIDRKKIDIRAASMREPSQRMRDEFRMLELFPYCIGDKGYRLPTQHLRQLLVEQRIETIVATTFKTYVCAKWAVRGSDIGVVFWIHAIRGVINGWIRRGIVRMLGRDDPLIFVSSAVRAAHLPSNHRGLSAVIHNGVADVAGDPHHRPYGAEGRQALGLPPGGIVLAYVAEFVECKDHPTAIRAMHDLVRRGVDAHLLLIGVGKTMASAQSLAASGPAADRIHFLGARFDVRRILGIVDVYLHPGREEGFGLAIVEAMLSGLPLVGAREGSMTELIESGQTGMLFNPGDSRDLANCVAFLAGDLENARKMGAAAREVCLQKFDVNAFAGNITHFLQNCFEASESPAAEEQIDAETAGAQG